MSINSVDQDAAAGLWDKCDPPCLTLYQSTSRDNLDSQHDPARFRNLVKVLEESLLQLKIKREEIQQLLGPLRVLAEDHDFWNCTLDGLAVLRSRNLFRVYKLQRYVPELAVVAESFHTKPLLRILQTADRYHVLVLTSTEMKLFEGNRDVLDEITPADGVPQTASQALADARHAVLGDGGRGDRREEDAERFFRVVDRAVYEQHSKPSGLPLILAALPEHHQVFHALSRNRFLVPECLDLGPDMPGSIDDLRQRAWQIMEPGYHARLAGLVNSFGNNKRKGLAGDDLAEVIRAAVGGRVATALIDARREIPGRIDSATGLLEYDDLSHPELDDALDDLGAVTLMMGGEVVVVPTDRMPTGTGIAAIYRY
jgi:hypothetical protein